MPYYGKYRGTVVDNRDPGGLARLKVSVHPISGPEHTAWALPCLPPGVAPVPPAAGANVWIEFEGGDLSSPIWCGVFWSDATHVPQAPPTPLDAWEVRTSNGAGIEIGAAGIVIDNGLGARIALAGPGVSVNHGALEIV